MRIAVVDDEKYARMELVRLIKLCRPQAEVFEAGSGVQAMQLLEKKTFDFLFIDIRLGDMEGTTVASLARRLMPQAKIIFATAFAEYAVTAFELHVDDYILKPYDPGRVREILCREEELRTPAKAETVRIAISSKRHTILLDPEEITYIESDGSGKGCVIHTLAGKQYEDGTALAVYEDRLRRQGFYRAHKTCLVHLKYIQDIFPWNNSSFALRVRGSDAELPIGRDKVKELYKYLNI